MSETISFVARDELAEWLEQRAEDRMKSISAICQDIVAAEYRRQDEEQASIDGQTQDDGSQTQDDGAEALESNTYFHFDTRRAANAVRTQFEEHVHWDDDKRLKKVLFIEGTPSEVVEEMERRSTERQLREY
jgi:predicted transcriptional regulator